MPGKHGDRHFLVALVDCDNFYVSCERVFKPALKDRALVILSNNDGCIVARSPEAKELGIGMGTPYHQAADRIKKHNVAVFSSNYTLYGDMSHRVLETLSVFSPEIEYYSIDEAFLLLERAHAEACCQEMRSTVLRHTGIPVTIGIGNTKTLAKVALEHSKKHQLPGGVFDLTTHRHPDEILSGILVQEVWGIGVKHAEWLYQRGINTAAQLKRIDNNLIQKRAGIVGLRTVFELRGMRCLPFQKQRPIRKNITSSCSFGKYVTSLSELKEAVATYASQTAIKLRSDGTVAGQLAVFITTNVYAKNPQYAKTAVMSLTPPTDCDYDLIKHALDGLEQIYKPEYRYIKAGVILSRLTPASQQQLDMFSSRDYEKYEHVYASVDSINLEHGLNTMYSLSCGIKRPWKMKQDLKSQRFTTRWAEIPIVSA